MISIKGAKKNGGGSLGRSEKRMDKVHLLWEGRRTIQRAKEALANAEWVEIRMPDDLNHTLFDRFNPNAPPGEIEELDISGGIEIIEKLGQVRALQDIDQLATSAQEAHAKVRIISPAPRLIISLPE